ncbi:hypothetical protein GIB67_033510 [Kingdonia uniflora]|uniref:Uncharacterized protein n=1 Tax=Kingdonia uniflora TaxID=39325 RepID=A0A7J7L631_9MAGN|nr:hypothetical protein GIB67_033510 [Kingdonia uniflora]
MIIREEDFVLEDVPHLTDFLPNLPTYPNHLQNSPAYAILKQHFVDPEDVVSQKIVTQKNSGRECILGAQDHRKKFTSSQTMYAIV